MNDQLEVFVLKQTDYREHDCIVQVLTKEYGVLSLFVRGMKKTTSKLAYAFQLFSLTKIEVDLKDTERMQTVKHATVVNSNRLLREDLELLSIMSVVAELTLKLAQHHSLYELVQQTISLIKETKQPLTILNLYLSHLVELEGSQLVVDECVRCGSKQGIVTVSLEDGGFVCESCNRLLHLPMFDVDTLKAIRVISKAKMHHFDKIQDYAVNQLSITKLLLDHLQIHSGITCTSRRFLENFLIDD